MEKKHNKHRRDFFSLAVLYGEKRCFEKREGHLLVGNCFLLVRNPLNCQLKLFLVKLFQNIFFV